MGDKIVLPGKVFVTGTDTDIGKTIVSSIITRGMKASYWKIIQTGDDSDSHTVCRNAGIDENKIIKEVYRLKATLSPYAASKMENIEIDIDKICKKYKESAPEILVAEGAGGVMVPIKKDYFMSDLIKELEMGALVVARSGLGTVNHTLLTIEHLKNKGVDIRGIVLSGELNTGNQNLISELSNIKTISIPFINMDNIDKIEEIFSKNFCINLDGESVDVFK